ncbi:DUF4184 family protein [Streptomyces sp. NRRL S-87]|uniref:DUF4184 family protein n=1 Tax=Streptomyces sp. NRRL S-87 TaxID=1463920 RepID=UPI0004C056EC|nr:DUF4184 family protein [Streptomyces sp. NRRL S-87]
MPFTLSHAAAVLPGIRRTGTARGPLLASALVAGSFAPDVTYFAASVVPGGMEFGAVTHSVVGVVGVDVLLSAGLVACWLLLREPLVALLPRAWRGRAYALARGADWRGTARLPLACRFWVSAVLGALTHVVWDGFTHPGRRGTDAVPALLEPVAGMPGWWWLQYGSSAVALLALGWFLVRAVRRLPGGPAPAAVPVLTRGERGVALTLLGAAVAGGVAQRVVRYFTFFDGVGSPLDLVPTVCFGAGAGLGVALPLYAVVVRLRRRRGPGAAASAGAPSVAPVPSRR